MTETKITGMTQLEILEILRAMADDQKIDVSLAPMLRDLYIYFIDEEMPDEIRHASNEIVGHYSERTDYDELNATIARLDDLFTEFAMGFVVSAEGEDE